jgi:hypothetical protein
MLKMENDIFNRNEKQLSDITVVVIDGVKIKAEELYQLFEGIEPCRESSIAKTKLEESIMWAVKAICSKKVG